MWALDPESMTPELWAKSQIASNYYISHAKKKNQKNKKQNPESNGWLGVEETSMSFKEPLEKKKQKPEEWGDLGRITLLISYWNQSL